jgi:alpha/beta superfamily hydrolase
MRNSAPNQVASGWENHGTWTGDGVRREVFFFAGAGCELYGSLYAADGVADARAGLVVCPSWGVEADRSDRLVHALALAMAELGGVGVVFHPPGYGDSDGDLSSVTMDALAAAAVAAVEEARSRQPAKAWVLAGFSIGASVASLALERAGADALLMVQPALQPAAYFGELARIARRVTLGTGASETVAFGYPLPARILESGIEADAAVAKALDDFKGRKAVVRQATSTPEADLPASVELVTAPGAWRFGAKEHPELARTALGWLERTSRAAAA